MNILGIGDVHPVPDGWNFDEPIHCKFKDSNWVIIVRRSQIYISIDTEPQEDLATFRTEMEVVAQGCVDALGFNLATPLRVELRALVVDGGTIGVLIPGWPQLLGNGEFPPLRVENHRLGAFLSASLSIPEVRYALADLRSAIERHDDTAFYCYRAVECVRQYFLDGNGDLPGPRKESWDRLRESLGVEREDLQKLANLAKSRRHGGFLILTESQRMEALLLARLVVEKFVSHISNLNRDVKVSESI